MTEPTDDTQPHPTVAAPPHQPKPSGAVGTGAVRRPAAAGRTRAAPPPCRPCRRRPRRATGASRRGRRRASEPGRGPSVAAIVFGGLILRDRASGSSSSGRSASTCPTSAGAPLAGPALIVLGGLDPPPGARTAADRVAMTETGGPAGVEATLALADWRRTIAALYAEVRRLAATDPAAALAAGASTRERLYREHVQSPVPAAARAGFRAHHFDHDPRSASRSSSRSSERDRRAGARRPGRGASAGSARRAWPASRSTCPSAPAARWRSGGSAP